MSLAGGVPHVPGSAARTSRAVSLHFTTCGTRCFTSSELVGLSWGSVRAVSRATNPLRQLGLSKLGAPAAQQDLHIDLFVAAHTTRRGGRRARGRHGRDTCAWRRALACFRLCIFRPQTTAPFGGTPARRRHTRERRLPERRWWPRLPCVAPGGVKTPRAPSPLPCGRHHPPCLPAWPAP